MLSEGSRVPVAAVKTFRAADSAQNHTYAADIGFASHASGVEPGEARLQYARVRGIEIGTRVSVGTDVPVVSSRLTLRASRGALELRSDEAGPVRVNRFGALGRHVARLFDGDLGEKERIVALPHVAAGVYVARAVQGAAHASVTVAR